MSASVSKAISLNVVCPACFARVNEPCNAPTNTGRRDVRWFHSSRTTLAAQKLSVEGPNVGDQA